MREQQQLQRKNESRDKVPYQADVALQLRLLGGDLRALRTRHARLVEALLPLYPHLETGKGTHSVISCRSAGV